MGLFEKKYCSICGNEIGLLGNRKLDDGNLCKDCTRKLSPWFTGRRHSTVEAIRQQLQLREENQSKLNSFNPNVVFGDSVKVYVDQKNETFVVSRSSDWLKTNADLISFSQVKDCEVNVEEDKEEVYQEVDGKKVSYDPKKYEYNYEFEIKIILDHPYLTEIEFELTNDEIPSQTSDAYKVAMYNARSLQHALLPGFYPEPEALILNASPENMEAIPFGDEWTCECGQVNSGKFCSECGKPKPTRWFCPECGKENFGKFCIECGQARPK